MGSDHWVAFYERLLKPCEDLVKTVNVVNVVITDMIFVKMFTLADFVPIIFYP